MLIMQVGMLLRMQVNINKWRYDNFLFLKTDWDFFLIDVILYAYKRCKKYGKKLSINRLLLISNKILQNKMLNIREI